MGPQQVKADYTGSQCIETNWTLSVLVQFPTRQTPIEPFILEKSSEQEYGRRRTKESAETQNADARYVGRDYMINDQNFVPNR